MHKTHTAIAKPMNFMNFVALLFDITTSLARVTSVFCLYVAIVYASSYSVFHQVFARVRLLMCAWHLGFSFSMI
jgi:hypothetical protein